MKAEHINPFLTAATHLFKDYIGIQLRGQKPYINEDSQNLYDISAIIGLAGDIIGAVVLSFPREVAIQMVSEFSGSEHTAVTNEVIDGVGELVNILAGNAKKYMEDFRIDISLPGVVTGTSYKINWPQGVPVITIPFASKLGEFTVNVSLKEI